MELWKDVIGYEGLYQISSLGNLKSMPRKVNKKYGQRFIKEKFLNGKFEKDGYKIYALSKNNITKHYKAHRLVAQAFIPNPDNKPQVNHINGIKDDNQVKNLEWVTNSENQLHSYKIGLAISQKGVNHGGSKLVEEQILAIRKDTRSESQIAKYYNVSRSLIGLIKRKKVWSHI